MILEALFFPGLVFMIALGFLYSGILRKLAARMQNRIGPPLLQPFWDFLKLLNKEDIIPEQTKPGYTFWPLLSASSVLVAGLMVPVAGFAALGFASNLLIIFYFLAMSSVALNLAGFSSSNPYAIIGSIRKITQSIGYEFPFLVSLAVPALVFGTLDPMIISQSQSSGWLAPLFPFAFFAFIISILAKTETPPFHVPEAHQEIVSGYLTEYTGSRLALIELAHYVKLYVLISLGVALYMGTQNILVFLASSLALLFLATVSRTVFARLRIDHVLRFAWAVGLIGLIDLLRVMFL
jgi:NADH-quinone oxidoreductase subunit H